MCQGGGDDRFKAGRGGPGRDLVGQATTTASDSKRFGSWDSNLMTEFHARYGGYGVMIYWHVEKGRVCIYSQLKTCYSSEVAAMIEGLLRHCTDADIEANYTDTHGASVVGFAFTELLGFKLLPRLKNIGSIRLYSPGDGPGAVAGHQEPAHYWWKALIRSVHYSLC